MLFNLLAGFLGAIFITVAKLKSFQTDATKLNLQFSYKKYFKEDFPGIILSFVSVFVWFLLFDEVASQYPKIITFIRCSYFAMGALGSWIIQVALSRTKGWIRCVADEKSNIADGKVEALKPV